MRYREPLCVFPRKLESGRIVYYYQTYDGKGKRTAGRPTGATTAREARWYCMKLYRAGTLGKPIKRPVTFVEYSVGWWDLNTCEYLKSRNARRQISSSYGRQARRNLEKYILPTFGSKRLDEITSYAIDTGMVSKLDKGRSGSSVNLMYTVLKVMLRHAVKKGLIAKTRAMRSNGSRFESTESKSSRYRRYTGWLHRAVFCGFGLMMCTPR